MRGVADLWWRCVDGHIFAAPEPPEGLRLSCPGFDDAGRCGTSFVFMPYVSKAEAEEGDIGYGEAKWAPWARGT